MLGKILWACLVAGCLGSSSVALSAQEVIHALTGTVSSIDVTAKTITLFQDSGSTAIFKDMTAGKTPISFDKKIRAETTSADDFQKKGAYAIVFYYGADDPKTAVAVRSLGAGPFTSTVGTVTEFSRGGHSISVRDNTGAVQTFKIDADTVAEGMYGVVDGYKFQADKNDHVRVVATIKDGTATALFVRDM